MVAIELRHNPFSNESKVLLDGKSYGVSEISKYLNSPFGHWADKIMECFSQETNDDFSLTYVGFEEYARILDYYRRKNNDCVEFIWKKPVLDEGVRSRLNKLNMLSLSGLHINRITEVVAVYTDMEDAERYFPKLNRLSYFKMALKHLPLSEFDGKANSPCFVISDKAPKTPSKQQEIYYFQISKESKFRGVHNGLFWELCDLDSLEKTIKSYVDMWVLTPALRKAVDSLGVIDSKSSIYRSLAALTEVEPKVIVEVPSNIELFNSVEIKHITVPTGSKADEVIYASHNPEVLRVHNNHIEAVGVGESFIEARCDGQLIGQYYVRVYNRIRAKEIRLFPDNTVMAVGETLHLQLHYQPLNADNISKIKLNVSSAVIAASQESVDSIIVKADKPGRAEIKIALEHLETGCSIVVYPKLECLEIALSKTRFKVGGISQVSLVYKPEEALLGDLIFNVSPEGIARHDKSVGALVGQKRGAGKLNVFDKRNNVCDSIDFYVE